MVRQRADDPTRTVLDRVAPLIEDDLELRKHRSTRSRACLAAVCAVMFASACKRNDAPVLVDSEGRAFSARCDASGAGCELTQTRAVTSPAGQHPALRANGRIIGVCPSAEASGSGLADCRPLVCERDADCPALRGTGSASCIDALCVDPAHDIGLEDSVMLCMAGTGLGHADRSQVERYALGLNCGTPCVVPKPCRQP